MANEVSILRPYIDANGRTKFRGRVGCDGVSVFNSYIDTAGRMKLRGGGPDGCVLIGHPYLDSSGRLMGRTMCTTTGVDVPCCSRKWPLFMNIRMRRYFNIPGGCFGTSFPTWIDFTCVAEFHSIIVYPEYEPDRCLIRYYVREPFMLDPPGNIIQSCGPTFGFLCSYYNSILWASPYANFTVQGNVIKSLNTNWREGSSSYDKIFSADYVGDWTPPKYGAGDCGRVAGPELPTLNWNAPSNPVIVAPTYRSGNDENYHFEQNQKVNLSYGIGANKTLNVSCTDNISFMNINNDENHLVSVWE